jgi:hypothetical protein
MKAENLCERACALLAAVSILLPSLTHAADDPLKAGFTQPPHEAKPWVYWFWMNGNITAEGITADLEAMAGAGLGGAILMNVANSIPPGPVDFFSEQWRKLFLHALKEAERLGLEINMTNADSWTGSAGPWITPDLSMQKLTWSSLDVSGPGTKDLRLPDPPRHEGLYRDIAVLAMPRTDDGLRPPDRVRISPPEVNAAALTDSDFTTEAVFPRQTKEPTFITMEFDKPFTAQGVTMYVGPYRGGHSGSLEVSDDGVNFRMVVPKWGIPRNGSEKLPYGISFPPATGKFFRFNIELAKGPAYAARILGERGLTIAEIRLHSEPRLPNFDGKGGFRRHDFKGFPEPADQAVANASAPEKIKDLSDLLQPDGTLRWEVPAGDWRILRIGTTSTAKRNHTATAGGEGLEASKIDAKAIEHHFRSFLGKLIEDAGPLAGRSLTMAHVDSWEVGAQNWGEGLREKFRQRAGYDPLPYLPVLTGTCVGDPEISERFLWDYRRVLADLVADDYYGKLRELAHRSGLTMSAEVYGSGNFESIQSAGRIDVPMAEFWVFQQPRIFLGRLASYSAHTYGRRIVGAEAFTGGQGRDKWQSHPATLKALGDAIYASGVNRFIIHRYAMQPWMDRLPGMTFGPHGIHVERTQTWWKPGAAWFTYLGRCQFLLQQGSHVADVLYFTDEGVPTDIPYLLIAGQLPDGYSHDVASRETLLERTRVENGRIVVDPMPLPGGEIMPPMSYRVLVMPNHRRMTLAMAEKIRDLVAAGATVIGPRPVASPSLADKGEGDEKLRRIADEVWGPEGSKTPHRYGQGTIYPAKTPVDQVLRDLGVAPALELRGVAEKETLRWFQRRDAETNTDIYFLANGGTKPEKISAVFRASGRIPEFWQPVDGSMLPAPFWRRLDDGRCEVDLTLQPSDSVFVVFRHPDTGAATPVSIAFNGHQVQGLGTAAKNEEALEVATDRNGLVIAADEAGSGEVALSDGRKIPFQVSRPAEKINLTGPWELSFPPGWKAPESMTLDTLASWHLSPIEDVRHFSGTATYRIDFILPGDLQGRQVVLDLGQVQVIAEVAVNGQNLGVLWHTPFARDITAAVKPGRNELTVKVTNLWANRLIGDEKFPPYLEFEKDGAPKSPWPDWVTPGPVPKTGRLTFTTWRHYDAKSPLLPSGLLGPVTVRVAEQVKVPVN